MTTIDGRTRHYGEFYGLSPQAVDARPLVVVWGNCQAEAVRILLASDPNAPFRTVRVPPVHELERADLPHLERVARSASLLVSQPVRSGYRDLPLGTADVEQMMAPGSRTLRWPVVRYAGLQPFQVIVRHPSDPSAVPAVVPYHDLRTILAIRDGHDSEDVWDRAVTPEALRAAAQSSLDELRRRERRDSDIAVSDVVESAGVDAVHTINHPGNAVLTALAQRVIDALGVGAAAVTPPDRHLLGGVRAPVEQRVLGALGLSGDPRITWTVDGTELPADDVHRAHLRWYSEHPGFVDAALARHADRIRTLGLSA